MSKQLLILISLFLVGCNPLSSSNTTFNPPSATLSASTPGTMKVALSWTASSGLPAGYQVEESTDNVNFTQVQQLTLTTSATVTGLRSNTTYYFRVRSFNQGGESPYTGTVAVTTGD
jgi:hypothetical protein